MGEEDNNESIRKIEGIAQNKTKEEEKPKESSPFEKIKNKIMEYRRVISVTSKPDKEEFISSVKITALGIILIGLIGFVIYLIYSIVI